MIRIACVLLLVLATYQFMVQAADPPTILLRDEFNCVDGCSKRTLFNIVWGCVSTTIICAWATIHPNIPPREGPLKGTLRRLELMFWTVVAPEILPAWALNQLLAAITVRDVYNDGKGYEQERRGFWETAKGWVSLYEIKTAASQVWTLKHGYFLIMGGFHVVEPPEDGKDGSTISREADGTGTYPLVKATDMDTEKGQGPSEDKGKPDPEQGRVTILTLEMLRELVKDAEFKIRITEEEVTHRSKGDALSKIIFILQSTWFIMQCLGRCVQELNLNQLELTTLALASLNGITFVLWWAKPLDAQAVVRVHLKRKLTDAERNIGGRGQPLRSGLIGEIQEFFGNRVTAVRAIILCRLEGNVFVAWLIRLPLLIISLVLSPILAFGLAFVYTIIDLAVGASTSFPAEATYVPTFYVPTHQYSRYFHVLLLMTLGTIFGGIHCAGWNLPFPTHVEQKLWHAASLAVTIIPIGVVPFSFTIVFIVRSLFAIFKSRPDFDETMRRTLVFSLLAYASARLLLLALALTLLRHLPESAFIAVDWTKFFPHL